MQYNRWIFEALSVGEAHVHGFLGYLVAAKSTPYQNLELVEAKEYGKILFIDGRIQVAEVDEFIYHEALVHPGLCCLEEGSVVFVAGGGDGGAIREIFKHPVKKVVMVDIDEGVVCFAKKYLQSIAQGAFDDSRLELIFQDAREYLEKQPKNIFDFIIMDITEPAEGSPSIKLFTQEFYQMIKERLKQNGMIVVQAGTTAQTSFSLFGKIYATLKTVFKIVLPYEVFVPSFATPWGFILTSENLSPLLIEREKIKQRIKKIKNLRFYSEDIHFKIFTLAPFIQQLLKSYEGKIITDKEVLVV